MNKFMHTCRKKKRESTSYWCKPVTGPGRAGWIQPSLYGWAQSSPVKKRVGQVWASGPSYFWLRLCSAKHTLMPFPCILFPFCFDISFYIRKFQKNLGIFVDLFMSSSYFVLFFSYLRFVILMLCSQSVDHYC